MSAPPSPITASKPHYVVLDGLRGTASLSIVVFHFLEMVYTDYSKNILGHAFLAVDFFFCLSGFVIAYAYTDRLKRIGLKEFFKSRLIRLHPLVILGSVLGLIEFILYSVRWFPATGSMTQVVLAFLCSVLLIPYPIAGFRGGGLFPFNTPSWSLWMEYLANVVYALVLYRLSNRWLSVLAGLAALALGYVSYRAGTLIGGWDRHSIWDGVARISYSFLAGMLVYRFRLIWSTYAGFVWLSLALLGTFMFPYVKANWALETIVVVFIYPLIIALGAGATVTGWLRRICIFFGRLSYPLYMSHIWAIWAFGTYYANHPMNAGMLTLIIAVSTLFLSGVAYLILRFYDEPVRAYLTRQRLKS